MRFALIALALVCCGHAQSFDLLITAVIVNDGIVLRDGAMTAARTGGSLRLSVAGSKQSSLRR